MNKTLPDWQSWLFLLLALVGAACVATVAVLTAPGAGV